MANYRFRKGLRIELRGRECSIEQRLSNGDFQIKDVAINEYRSIEEACLVKFLFNGELQILGDEQTSTVVERRAARLLVSDLGMLEDDLRERTKRRHRYVREINAQKVNKLTKETLAPLIEKVSEELGDPVPPSWLTLYRWYKQCQASDHDIRALVPAFKRRGNRRCKLSGGDAEKAAAIAKIIDDVIAEKYLNPCRPTIESVCDTVYARIDNANHYRSPEDQLSLPHRVSIYRIVKKLDPYEVMKARYGARLADHKFGSYKQGTRPARPLERVEIDHTKLDMLVVDEDARLPIGRPWLTLALDVYSKMIVGMYVSFNPPGYLSLMQCLLHAIQPKTYVSDRYQSIQNTWDAYGIPENIVCDNGPEFHSSHFEDACLQMGIIVHYAPVKRGQFKGSVERYFRTLNQKLLHEHPGTTFSNIVDKADYEPKKNAIISYKTLKELIHLFIIDIYHQREHRALRDTPAHMWKVAIAEYPPALPAQQTDLSVLLSCITKRAVFASGIQLHTLTYRDEKLAGIRRKLKTGEKVEVKYDPEDLSLIYVADKEKGIYIQVHADNQSYTQNLTLWQHEVIKRYAQQRVKGIVNIVDLCLAKEKIQKIVERERLSTRKTHARQKIARFLNLEQQSKITSMATSQSRKSLVPAQRAIGNGLAQFGTDVVEESMTKHPLSPNNNFPMLLAPQPSHSQRVNREYNEEAGSIALESDEADLDMSGWDVDFDLPR